MNLRVSYSIGSRFGTGDSLGALATNDVQALSKEGWLTQLLVGSYRPGSVPNECTHQLGALSRGLRKLATYDPRGYINAFSDDVYDAWGAHHLKGCDVLHTWGQMSLATMRHAQMLGAKTLLVRGSSHTLTQAQLVTEEFERHGLTYPPTPRHSIDKALVEFAEADAILVPSEFVYQSFLAQNFPAAKLIVNPYGVDTTRFRPGVGDEGQLRVVFVGQVSLRKGIQYLLAAWQKLRWPNATLTIIGPIQPEARAVIATYRADPSIHWVGYVNNLEDYLGRMSFFVFPSIEEGSALVTYIAMACGLPIITTFNAGSVARHEQDGYIVPIRDVDALCQRMEQLLTDTELRVTLGAAARQHIEQYSWAHYQARLIALYQKHFVTAHKVANPHV